MLRFSRTKIFATLAVILIGLSLAVPSFVSKEQRDAFVPQRELHLVARRRERPDGRGRGRRRGRHGQGGP